MNISPHLLTADTQGNILDDPSLLMVCDRAGQWNLPDHQDLVELPPESELFLLPGRHAAGFDPDTGKMVKLPEFAVAAFIAPGYTLSAHPAYYEEVDAPVLPLFAYGAVGYARDRFWVCAAKVDEDKRQQFGHISKKNIARMSQQLLINYPKNRLVSHIINNCVRRYNCPAARNFALGRFEAPLPTSRTCNARCVGCISLQAPNSPIQTTPQCRLNFTPTSAEIVEVMKIHEQREKKTPIYSFGQGCEGDPLTNYELLAESIANFRALQKKKKGGTGTINCNTNASNPHAVRELANAGLTSMRASLNSAQPDLYEAYYRPVNYTFADVRKSLYTAAQNGVFVSLNLLYFPGITDTCIELEALSELCTTCGVSMIQWRNLNIDPGWYARSIGKITALDSSNFVPAMGLHNFMKRLKKSCPWLRYGYFNPWLGDKATLTCPHI